jgi:hypothetical protein
MIQASQLFAACSFKIISTQIDEDNTNTLQVNLSRGATLTTSLPMIKIHTEVPLAEVRKEPPLPQERFLVQVDLDCKQSENNQSLLSHVQGKEV